MTISKNKITKKQLIFLIIQAQIGVGILSLPHDVALVAKQDGWMGTIIAGGISQAIIFAFWGLSTRFPTLSLYEILPKILGKIVGKLLILSYALYFMITGSLVLARFSDILDKWILPRTPNWITMVLILITCIYIVSAGLTSIARFYMLVSPILFVLVVLIGYAMKDANFLYILPVGNHSIFTILKASKEAAFSMLGFELFLFIHSHVQATGKEKLIAITTANIFVTFYYTFLVFAALVYFEPNIDIGLTPEPLLYMIKAYSFQVLERTDLFFRKKNHKRFLPFVAVAYLILAVIPDQGRDFENFNHILGPTHYIFIGIIPTFLLILSWMLSKKEVVNKL
ncbi:GerAB/ArcD/ProY family transporter [Bacillus sp. JJ1764]|uniref:GerAB/ArcD/ProY family transporter n=1 Tax=Bacillus sp. JJ1764 TaxID=3122964 RepID=UPI00300079C1